MNFNQRRSNREWERINQCPGNCFPADWNFEEDFDDYDYQDSYTEERDDKNNFDYGYNKFYKNYGCNKPERKEDSKCYCGKFFFCEKENRKENNGHDCNRNDNKKNYGEKGYTGCDKDNEHDRRPDHRCRCPRCCLCNFFRNFHC